MIRAFIVIAFIFTATGVSAQSGTFHGIFASMLDGERILYARVSATHGDARLTNSGGYVAIPCFDGDILTVTHISYDTFYIDTRNIKLGDTSIYYLTPRTYELREVTFSILGPRPTFDNRFVALDLGLTDEQRVKEKLKIEEMKDDLIALDQAAQEGMVLGSPITAIYEQFSRAAAERRKYEALLRQDVVDSLNARKFNASVVSMLTEMSPEDAEAFIKFCSFHEDYIRQSSPIQLYIEILRCKQQYFAEPDN